MTARMALSAFLVAACAAVAAWGPPARAADPSESILLVARRDLHDRLYGSAIIVAHPIGGDRHVGFIVNKPTKMTLGKLFPRHEPSRKVVDPVFLGGPVSPEVIFALVQARQNPGGRSIRILEDLYLAVDSDVVDRVIEKQSSQARFVAGMVLWRPGELDEELRRGLWYVQDASTDVILRRPTDTMWEELVGPLERKASTI
jgi:putative transcriptional regulator